MLVYLVVSFAGSTPCIDAIFSTEEQAEKFLVLEREKKIVGEEAYILPKDIDYLESDWILTTVFMDKNGLVDTINYANNTVKHESDRNALWFVFHGKNTDKLLAVKSVTQHSLVAIESADKKRKLILAANVWGDTKAANALFKENTNIS